MKRSFRAMGTEWWISADACRAQALAAAEAFVHGAEREWSRFRPDSRLSRLNCRRAVDDDRLAALLTRALELRDVTGGAFDPALGGAVIAAGYDRSFEEVSVRPGAIQDPGPRPTIAIQGSQIRLSAGGAVDLGGIAKGWTADAVGAQLEASGARRWVVDAGGDILVGAAEPPVAIALGAAGYAVNVSAGAVATSSSLERRWASTAGEKHHIIAPESATSAASDFVLVSVLAPQAATADALATALLADPPRTLPALAAEKAVALLVDRAGRRLMTPGLREHLR